MASLPSVQRALANVRKNAGAEVSDEALLEFAELAAEAASDILYEKSGRLFSGECGPVTVRPVSRPVDIDSRTWGARLSPLGWYSSWGVCSAYGSYSPGIVSHYGCSNPPQVDLGVYPVTEIVQVKIDGVTIPATEYELRDKRYLVRIRKSTSVQPTERYGWPTCQVPDLTDDQQGTFSVRYKWGVAAPASGKLAAKKLAEYLLLPTLGDTTRAPLRTTSMSRQGVNLVVTDVMDLLAKGMLGIYEVDLFLESINPHQNQRQAMAWSPDIGRPRRQIAT